MGRASRRKRRNVFLTSARSRPRQCPVCGAVHDAATAVSLDQPMDHRGPPVGDLCICADCGALNVATATGFRVATQNEVDGLAPELQVLAGAAPFKKSRTKQ